MINLLCDDAKVEEWKTKYHDAIHHVYEGRDELGVKSVTKIWPPASLQYRKIHLSEYIKIGNKLIHGKKDYTSYCIISKHFFEDFLTFLGWLCPDLEHVHLFCI